MRKKVSGKSHSAKKCATFFGTMRLTGDFFPHFRKFFPHSGTVEENTLSVKEGPLGIFEHPFCPKKLKEGPFGDIEKKS